jgi:hypothetical protein
MKYSNLSGDLVQSFIINSISVKYIAPDKKKDLVISGVIWCKNAILHQIENSKIGLSGANLRSYNIEYQIYSTLLHQITRCTTCF